jgi:serine/threonine protein kinase
MCSLPPNAKWCQVVVRMHSVHYCAGMQVNIHASVRRNELPSFQSIMQEFCVGGSLAKLLSGDYLLTPAGGVNISRVLTILRHVASGMAYMHKLRMVHGDLNPSNIVLQIVDNKYVQTPRRRRKAWKPLTREAARGLDNGQCVVKLADFGLTVQLQHGHTHVSNIKQGALFRHILRTGCGRDDTLVSRHRHRIHISGSELLSHITTVQGRHSTRRQN